ALALRIVRRERRVRLGVVDDRDKHLIEACAFENVDEARLDAASPRGLFDQQRPHSRWIPKLCRDQTKTPFAHRSEGGRSESSGYVLSSERPFVRGAHLTEHPYITW